ncbi:MAG: TatD family hydrolase [Bacteroidia bacterium]|nr:TatD family hydrolase [Bacteroidia bacterium]
MMEQMFIDIHSHQDSPHRPDLISIRNILIKGPTLDIPREGLFSFGVHPWDSDRVSMDKKSSDQAASLPQVIAIGECGIDRLKGAPVRSQALLFTQHAGLAELRQKPLIIHCVRAWHEIMSLKTELSPKVPWIIHGFRGKIHIAAKLVDMGFYLSFGESLLSFNPVLSEILRNTPDNRFFLESDEGRRPIEDIYDAASRIKKLSLERMQSCLASNFEKVFGIHDTSRMAGTD